MARSDTEYGIGGGTLSGLSDDSSKQPALVLTAENGDAALTIPDAIDLLHAQFSRNGSDLVVESPDGTTAIILGYFSGPSPALMTEGGGRLSGHIVSALAGPQNPAQFAQDGADATSGLGSPIGEVQELEGGVTITRANGVTVEVVLGDPVFEDDVIETAGDGAIGILFIDDTSFALGEDARMILDEYVYDPDSGEAGGVLNVVQGPFTFVSGNLSKMKADSLTVDTPTLTIGIRGTTVVGRARAEGEETTIALLKDEDGGVGEIIVSNDTTTYTMDQENQTMSGSSRFEALSAPEIRPFSEIQQLGGNAMNNLPTQQGMDFRGNRYDAPSRSGDNNNAPANGDGENGEEGEGDADGENGAEANGEGEGDGEEGEEETEGDEDEDEGEDEDGDGDEDEGEGDGDSDGDGEQGSGDTEGEDGQGGEFIAEDGSADGAADGGSIFGPDGDGLGFDAGADDEGFGLDDGGFDDGSGDDFDDGFGDFGGQDGGDEADTTSNDDDFGFDDTGVVQDPPILGNVNFILDPVAEDSDGVDGTPLDDLLDGQPIDFSGGDPGLAIVGLDASHGDWSFSTDGGSSFVAIDATDVGLDSAVLLTGSPDNRIKFTPDPDFNGTADIQFVAWIADPGRNGEVGANADAAIEPNFFSENIGDGSITVTPVNDAPVRTVESQVFDIFDQSGPQGPDEGEAVNANDFGFDIDGDPLGVAIIGADNSNGQFQYSLDGGQTFLNLTNVGDEGALLLTSGEQTRIRFIPNQGFEGTANLTFLGWDQTDGSENGTVGVDTTIRGGTAPFSADATTAIVNVINAPPPEGDPMLIAQSAHRLVDFDGIDDHAEAMITPDLLIDCDLTIEAWINFDPFGVEGPQIFTIASLDGQGSGGDANDLFGLGLVYDGFAAHLRYFHQDAADVDVIVTANNPDSIIPVDQWVHVAVTRQIDPFGTDVYSFFRNGELLETRTATADPGSASNGTLILGADQDDSANLNRFFEGDLDEVKIYDRAKSNTEIKDGFRFGTDPMETGLVAFYQFNNASGDFIDSAGGDNNISQFSMTLPTRDIHDETREALLLDGQSGFVDVGNDGNLLLRGDMTITAWAFPFTSGGEEVQSIITAAGNGETQDTNTLFSLEVSAAGELQFTYETDSGTDNTVTVDTRDFTFDSHHGNIITVTREFNPDAGQGQPGYDFRFYADGNLISTQTIEGVLSGADGINAVVEIGRHPDGSQPLDGDIDNVAIWNRALTETEIQDQVTEIDLTDPALLLAYDFNFIDPEGAGPGIFDFAGDDNPGALVGGAVIGFTAAEVQSSAIQIQTFDFFEGKLEAFGLKTGTVFTNTNPQEVDGELDLDPLTGVFSFATETPGSQTISFQATDSEGRVASLDFDVFASPFMLM